MDWRRAALELFGRVRLEMLGEEVKSGVLDLSLDLWRGFPEAMIAAFDGHEFGFDIRGQQSVDEPDGLFMSDIFVIRAVDTQSRSSFGCHPIQRTGFDVAVSLFLKISTQK